MGKQDTSPASRWRRIGSWSLAGLVALSLAGCYTALKHPQQASYATADLDDSCIGCHADDGPPDSPDPYWIEYYSWSDYPWINYYGSPWWVDSSWYHHREDHDSADEEDHRLDPPQRILGRWGWAHRDPVGVTSPAPAQDLPAGGGPITSPPPPAASGRLPLVVPPPVSSQTGDTPSAQTEEKKEESKKEEEAPAPKTPPRVLRR